MRCKTRTIFVIGCVGLIGLSAPALGNPNSGNSERETAPPLPQARPVQLPQARPEIPQARPVQQRRHAVHRPQRAARPPVRYAAPVARAASNPFSELFASARSGQPPLVAEARKYIGTNPTNRSRLWCANFMNLVLARTGYAGTGSDAARSFAYYGRRISEPKVGAIAVLTRGKRGGHVGVVTGIDPRGNPIIISGNSGSRYNRRVRESVYSRKRVIAYVLPTEHREVPATSPQAAPAPRQVAQARPNNTEIESPIAELLAAIANERMAPQRAPQPRPVQRAQPAPPPVPHRVVQQTALPPPQNADGDGPPLDPLLAEFFGLNERDDARPVRRSRREG